jgi:hypothetical protein
LPVLGRTAVPADPHEALGIDVDAVLTLGPFIAVALAAPGAQEIAVTVEHQDRRRGAGEIRLIQQSRPLQEVDVAL